MSLIKVVPGKYDNCDALKKTFDYCTKKIYDGEGCKYWDGAGICSYSTDSAVFDMIQVKYYHGKMDKKQLHHFVIHLKRKEIDDYCEYGSYGMKYDKRNDQGFDTVIGLETCEIIYNLGYQNAFFLHEDSSCYHIHFILNSVNFITGAKLDSINHVVNKVFYYLKGQYRFLNFENIIYC